MGLFRAMIQHRRRLRLLVSGLALFDELGQIWNDHFINVREVRVGYLDRFATIDLLMRAVRLRKHEPVATKRLNLISVSASLPSERCSLTVRFIVTVMHSSMAIPPVSHNLPVLSSD